MGDHICLGAANEDGKCLRCENKRLQQWVDDLLAGKNVNCVYCGFNFGPEAVTSATMADTLTEHIEQCPKHPLTAAKKRIEELEEQVEGYEAEEYDRQTGDADGS